MAELVRVVYVVIFCILTTVAFIVGGDRALLLLILAMQFLMVAMLSRLADRVFNRERGK